MNNYIYPTPEEISEHNAEKAKWMSAKMGITHFCSECGAEVYFDSVRFIWLHKGSYGTGYVDCQVPQDIYEQIARPMTDGEMEDWHDRIMEDDWYYAGKDPYSTEGAE